MEIQTQTRGYVPQIAGTVTPPADMLGAARESLSPAAFHALLDTTGGRAPTSAELCAAVEAERARNDQR